MAKKKLTDKQWLDIEKRYYDNEPGRKIAKDYGITEGAIRKRYSTQKKQIEKAANQIVKADRELEKLSIRTQTYARDRAAYLKSTFDLVAKAGYDSAELLSGHLKIAKNQMANVEIVDIDKEGKAVIEVDQETLQKINALSTIANNAGKTAMELVRMNIDAIHQNEDKELPVFKYVEHK